MYLITTKLTIAATKKAQKSTNKQKKTPINQIVEKI